LRVDGRGLRVGGSWLTLVHGVGGSGACGDVSALEGDITLETLQARAQPGGQDRPQGFWILGFLDYVDFWVMDR
jgi:hypothetical protein